MPHSGPSKPFLKRGTRQFLSNAQQRSQPEKPKIVDFGADMDNHDIPTQSNSYPEPVESVVVNVKRSAPKQFQGRQEQAMSKRDSSQQRYQPKAKNTQSNNSTQQENIPHNIPLAPPPTAQYQPPLPKKKPGLADYLGLGDQNVQKNTTNAMQKTQLSNKKIDGQISQAKSTIKGSLHSADEIQDLSDDMERPNSFVPEPQTVTAKQPAKNSGNQVTQSIFSTFGSGSKASRQIVIDNSRVNKQDYSAVPNAALNSQQSGGIAMSKMVESSEVEHVEFKSDDEGGEAEQSMSRGVNCKQQSKKDNEFSKTFKKATPNYNQTKQPHFIEANTQAHQNETSSNNFLERYIQKTSKPFQVQKKGQGSTNTTMSVESVPEALKVAIITTYISAEREKLVSQLQKIKNEAMNLKKKEDKLEEEKESLAKQRRDFERQMEAMRKQFQEKKKQSEQDIKAVNQKMNRQKRYMKDQQMAGRGDWKAKSEIEQLRFAVEQAKQEKKRIQVRNKTEIDRLKMRLDEQMAANKELKEEIRILEMGRIKETDQIRKQMKAAVQQASEATRVAYWSNAPQNSFLHILLNQGFSLFDLTANQYQFNANEYYQWSLQNGDDGCQLERQQQPDDNKIIRRYRNGKVQHELLKKLIKDVYPFGYTVIHHYNGDVKQTLPQGLTILYDSKSQITQIVITPNKKIYYFQGRGQIQLRINDKPFELLTTQDNLLQRIGPDGRVRVLKKEAGRVSEIMKLN